uniref:Uncharacterized protein n=1 Tax=Neogobius melanostomus TaxID=47308 RepID=A0A8C6U7F1_9GOBI
MHQKTRQFQQLFRSVVIRPKLKFKFKLHTKQPCHPYHPPMMIAGSQLDTILHSNLQFLQIHRFNCERRRMEVSSPSGAWWCTPRRSCHRAVGDLHSDASVQRYVQQLMEDFTKLDQRLQRASLSEADRRAILKKHTELLPLVKVCQTIEQAVEDHQEVLSLLQGEFIILEVKQKCYSNMALFEPNVGTKALNTSNRNVVTSRAVVGNIMF